MKPVTINVSLYNNKRSSRLAVLQDNCGTRIKGAKFNDFQSEREIDVELNEVQVKELIKELQRMLEVKE